MIRQPYVSAWRCVNGVNVEPIAPDDLPDYSVFPTGMYWPVGQIAFCIDSEYKRAVFTFVLGPRYARGYKTTFEDLESSAFSPDRSKMVWMS